MPPHLIFLDPLASFHDTYNTGVMPLEDTRNAEMLGFPAINNHGMAERELVRQKRQWHPLVYES
jgi:hypothetical protein